MHIAAPSLLEEPKPCSMMQIAVCTAWNGGGGGFIGSERGATPWWAAIIMLTKGRTQERKSRETRSGTIM